MVQTEGEQVPNTSPELEPVRKTTKSTSFCSLQEDDSALKLSNAL